MSEEDAYTAIAFDPGGTTGWSVTSVELDAIEDPDVRILDSITHWSAGEFTGPEHDQVDQMLELVDEWADDADIVMEKFILRMMSMDPALLSPVRIGYMFEYGLRTGSSCRRSKRTGQPERADNIIWQQPSLAMTTMTDDRLRSIGLWIPTAGKPHARDATRHTLTWLRRKKERYQRWLATQEAS